MSNRRENEKRYFKAVGVVARLKSKLYVMGARQSLLEDEINKATSEVQRQRAKLTNFMELTPIELETARVDRLGAIRMLRERLTTLGLKECKDLVDQAVPPAFRS